MPCICGSHELYSSCGRLWTRLVALYYQYPVAVLDFWLVRVSDGKMPCPALDLAETDHGPGGIVFPVPLLPAALRPVPAEPALAVEGRPALLTGFHGLVLTGSSDQPREIETTSKRPGSSMIRSSSAPLIMWRSSELVFVDNRPSSAQAPT